MLAKDSVKNFFKGKSIFITGGTGFIGKVIIEKLLRSYDGIKNIYILLREKKNKSPEERLQIITECELFDKLKETNPEAFNKLIPLHGDLAEIRLGLSEQDINTIIQNVDIIYHGAASVRFDDHLKDSVILNARGTKELLEIALEGKKTITFLHISTAYCNVDKMYIKEELYPPHADWRSTLKIVEEVDGHVLSTFTAKYIHPLPNTYLFAKSLAEHIVTDLAKERLSAAIVRPSIVISTYNEPYSGFVDNFNGPTGLFLASGKGIMKIYYGEIDGILNYLSVDLFVKLLIGITYEKALSKNTDEIPIYNTTGSKEHNLSNRDTLVLGSKLTWDAPITRPLWFPSFSMTSNWLNYYILFLLYQMIPALFLDGLLKLTRQKPMLIKLQRKIYVTNMALAYFVMNSWTFVNDKSLVLIKKLTEMDCEELAFPYAILNNWTADHTYAYFRNAKIGAIKTLLKEEFDMKKGYKNTFILWILDSLLHFTIYGLLCWYFIVKLEIFSLIINMRSEIWYTDISGYKEFVERIFKMPTLLTMSKVDVMSNFLMASPIFIYDYNGCFSSLLSILFAI